MPPFLSHKRTNIFFFFICELVAFYFKTDKSNIKLSQRIENIFLSNLKNF